MKSRNFLVLAVLLATFSSFANIPCHAQCLDYQWESRIYPGCDNLRIDIRAYDLKQNQQVTFFAILLRNPGSPEFNFQRDHRMVCLGTIKAIANKTDGKLVRALSDIIYDLEYSCRDQNVTYGLSLICDKEDLKCIPSLAKQYFRVLPDKPSGAISSPKDGARFFLGSPICVKWDRKLFAPETKLRISLRKIYTADAYDELFVLENEANDGQSELYVPQDLVENATHNLLDMVGSDYCWILIQQEGREIVSDGLFSIFNPKESPNFGPRQDK